jgi:glucose/arabinose dehydrogenase
MKKLLPAFLLLFAATFTNTSQAQYTTTQVITGINQPVCMAIAPDDRIFVTLRGGSQDPATDATVEVYDGQGNYIADLWNFTDSTELFFERGILGVALDPDFSNNHYVYVFYNHLSPTQIRVVRLTETNGVGSNPTIILAIDDPHTAGNHTGGNIHFRPSEPNQLYVTIGDRATSSNSQLLTNPFGKILRINSDGTIPTDNPFYDDGNPNTSNDDRIWAYGLRNSFDFTFSTVNDSLYSSENGWNTQDEVNQIHKGGNYGWPDCEGFTGTCTDPSFIAPMDVWNSPLPAVTGIIVYESNVMPAFTGHMFVGDYDNGAITDFTLTNAPANDQVTNRQTAPWSFTGITDMAVGNEGCIYVLEGGYTPNGSISKICPDNLSIGENNNAPQFSIFPNPAEQHTLLRFSEGYVGKNYEILDVLGNVIDTRKIEQTEHQFDRSGLSAGIYFIKAYYESGYRAERIIIKD